MHDLSETDFNTLRDHYIADGMYDDKQCPFAVEDIPCDKYEYGECTVCSHYDQENGNEDAAA